MKHQKSLRTVTAAGLLIAALCTSTHSARASLEETGTILQAIGGSVAGTGVCACACAIRGCDSIVNAPSRRTDDSDAQNAVITLFGTITCLPLVVSGGCCCLIGAALFGTGTYIKTYEI